MQEFFNTALGIADETLNWWQMSLRAVVVFFSALIIIQIGNPRIFGKNTAFDIILGIIYGSILSRAITGNAPLWPTIIAAFALVLLHRGLAYAAYVVSGGFGIFLKGRPIMLIKEGEKQHQTLRANSVTENDLLAAIRKCGGTNVAEVHPACLERSGDISIVLKK